MSNYKFWCLRTFALNSFDNVLRNIILHFNFKRDLILHLDSKHNLSIHFTVLWMTIAAALSIAAVSSQATSTSKYLSEDDKAKARAIVDAGFSLEDVPSVHYAVLAYKLTDTKIPKTAVSSFED